ncbi:hypothetical protein ACHAAC_11105 [Aeromicrobium sp. CF4.19]|uniref:hypothetical protein n=1 Tax=Aeromicrobium sp. CF4.19 TaxID=3373082 RepID=UPI003EE4D89F
MMNHRRLATAALALALALGVSACGSDDETRPLPTSGTLDMEESSASPTPSVSPDGDDADDAPIDRSTRERLERVALEEVGDGRVEDVERSDDSSHAYEVDVERRDDDVTVEISEDFEVVRVDR